MNTPTWPWRTNSLQPPDWRHRAAVRRSASSAAGSADEADGSDLVIRLATRFYRILRRANSQAARRQAATRMPAMAAVHSLFSEQHDLRETVVLRLLAGVHPIVIGISSAIDPKVVTIFHDLHFDVISHLGRVDYMLGCVLQPDASGTDTAAMRRWGLRMLAWLGGERAVETLICPVPRGDATQGECSRSSRTLLSDTAQAVHQRDLALALLAAKFDHNRIERLADGFAATAIKRAEPAGDPGENGYVQNVQAFLDHVKFTTGPGGLDHVPSAQRKYYEGPVEPNAEEWAAIARGQPVPTLDAKIEISAQARRERESQPLPPAGT